MGRGLTRGCRRQCYALRLNHNVRRTDLEEYFYITCGAASLAAFVAYVLEKTVLVRKERQLRVVIAAFATTTLLFRLWFFFIPTNPIVDKIAQRSVLVSSYSDGEKRIDIVEGEFEVDILTWGNRVLLLPFSSPP